MNSNKRLALVPLLALAMLGCQHRVPVTTMEAAIREAALAAQTAGDAVAAMTLELSVTTGYKVSAGATLPVSVVPITLGGEGSQTNFSKVTFNVDPSKYTQPRSALDTRAYILDLDTGLLIERKP